MRLACLLIFLPLFSFSQDSFQKAAAVQMPPVRELSVGDPVPEHVLDDLLGISGEPLKASIYKKKLILLDFWATNCTSCIRGFPKLDSLLRVFSDELLVVLVNNNPKDNQERLKSFFGRFKRKDGSAYSFAQIINDTLLSKLFPHESIPHYVWIDEGQYIAATYPDDVSITNIKKVLNNETVSFNQKVDIPALDHSKPLLTQEIPGISDKIKEQGIITAFIPGLTSSNGIARSRTFKKFYSINRPILNIYHDLLNFKPGYLIVDPSDAGNILLGKKPVNEENDQEWRAANSFCFEYIAGSSVSIDQFRRNAVSFLNRSFGLYGRFEDRYTEVFVIKNTRLMPRSSSKGFVKEDEDSVRFINQPLAKLIHRLNYYPEPVQGQPIFIEETTIPYPVDLTISHGALHDPKLLEKDLFNYGLVVEKEQRKLRLFVLSVLPVSKKG